MTGFIVSVFPFRNRVSSTEAFEGLELGEGKPSRPVLRGPGGRKAAWLLGNHPETVLWEVEKATRERREMDTPQVDEASAARDAGGGANAANSV